MKKWMLGRLAGAAPLFIGITLLSFAVMHLAPGDAVQVQAGLNPKMTAQARAKLTELYGLDKPLYAQYTRWALRIFRFDFGESFVDGEKVTRKILQAIPVTLGLNLLSLVVIFSLGVPLGIWGAVRKGTLGDNFSSFLTLMAFSTPTFWAALLLMSFFGIYLRLLPVSGLHSITFQEKSFLWNTWDVSKHIVLPVLVSSLTGLAGISRFMRSGMLETLEQNYIRTARAKGLSENAVLYKHALKNALLPVVTILGLSVPGLLGGSVVMESIFSIPGMGRLFFSSVFSRDYPVIMGILVLGAFLTLLGNFLADLSYTWLDPRIRLLDKK